MPLIPGMDIKPLIAELKDRVSEELDYALEAQAQEAQILADLAVTTAIGMAIDNLIWPTRQSVAAANEIEYRAWLLRHGAQSATANSAIVRAMYDTVFAYPGFGRMLLDASMFGDIATLEAATLVTVFVAVMTQFLGDLGYMLLNPRIRVR